MKTLNLMKNSLILFLVFLASGAALAAPKGVEQRAVEMALSHSELKIRYAGLLALRKQKGANSTEFYWASQRTLGDIDQQLKNLEGRVLSEKEFSDYGLYVEWKSTILQILIQEGGALNNNLRRYLRANIGTERIDVLFMPKIFEFLRTSSRSGQDELIELAMGRFLHLATLAEQRRSLPPMLGEQPTILGMIPELEGLVRSKRVTEPTLLIRLARLAKSLKVPHKWLSQYIGQIKMGRCEFTIGSAELETK